jgi:pimeloyl-ACP methyl ester carboxylesterase
VQIRGYEPDSQPEDGDYSLAAIATDVLAFLDELQAERAHLIGHDWGAAIAYVAGATAPQRFSSLVTLAVPHSGRFLAETPQSARQLRLSWYMLYFQLRGLADWHLRRNDYAFIRRLWRDWSPGWQPAEETLDTVIESFRQPGVGAAALAYYRAALDIRSLPLTSAARQAAQFKVPVPTLALTGAEDGCIDSAVFQRMMYAEDFPAGLKVIQVPAAGHFLHREQPEKVNAAIVDWLQQRDQ